MTGPVKAFTGTDGCHVRAGLAFKATLLPDMENENIARIIDRAGTVIKASEAERQDADWWGRRWPR